MSGKNPEIKNGKQTEAACSGPKNKFLLISGAFVLGLSALATALYSLSINQKIHYQLADANNKLVAQIQELKQEQDATRTEGKATTNKIEDSQTVLHTQFEALNKELQRALNEQYYQNQNWILLKARYCLELAQINVHWSKNFDATIALLEQADQLIHDFNEPKIFSIRQAIAHDIAALKARPTVDIVGLLSKLDAVQNTLNDLNIMSTDTLTTPEAPVTSKNTLSIWRLRLQDSINLLNRLVVIRHNEKPIEPFISPKFQALLKENIHLNLQEAQWAVLNNNPQIYQLVIHQAITTIKNNFHEQEPNTAALLKILDELEQVELNPQIPDINSALPLINELIDASPKQGEKKL